MYDCSGCKQAIVAPSPVASYENKYYHPDCLVCNSCQKTLSGKQFLKEKNGLLTCETCNAKTAPKCLKCNQIFAPGESYKKLNEKTFYHNECFKCCGPCRKPIGAEFYDLEDGRFICVDCYDKYGSDFEKFVDKTEPVPSAPVPSAPAPPSRLEDPNNLVDDFNSSMNLNKNPTNTSRFNPYSESLPPIQRDPATRLPRNPEPEKLASNDNVCAKCGKILSGTFTVYNEKKYHAKCFVCCQCNQEFKEKQFFKLNGNPLCRDCHTQNQLQQASKCHKCAKPILDSVVSFKNSEYHDQCLVCNLCSKRLVGQSIYCDKKDNPFCVDCFTKKESKQCGKCMRPIAPNQTNLVFEDKNFHKECFSCQTCSKMISSSETFYKSDDGHGIVCVRCS